MTKRAPAARPVDVLIASMHEWTSRALASILSPHGYIVHRAYNRAQTLARIRNNPPDAVIVDEELPDADGHALCRELSEEDLLPPSTPIFLALLRPPTRRDRLAALHARAWACLGEPLDAEELISMLDVFVPAKLEADQARAQGLVGEQTGVYNARGLTRRAEELAAQASRRHTALCCLLLVPEIEPEPGTAPENDKLPVWLLRRIASVLRSTARRSDAIGRLSGHSFAVIAVDTNSTQARHLAERLAAAIIEPSGSSVPALPRLRVRAGCHAVADLHAAPMDVPTLMLEADTALRRARADSTHDWLQGCGAYAPLP